MRVAQSPLLWYSTTDSYGGDGVGKNRLVNFTDAVLAIIITILVLDLAQPAEPTLEALLDLREYFFAYIISFFWLGAMWINLHDQWHTAARITTRVVLHTLLMLFFFSLIPYITKFAGNHLMDFFAQGVYWLVSTLATVNIMAQGYALGYANREDKIFLEKSRTLNHWMWVDLAVCLLGLPLAYLTGYAPMVMIITVASAIIPSIVVRFLNHQFET